MTNFSYFYIRNISFEHFKTLMVMHASAHVVISRNECAVNIGHTRTCHTLTLCAAMFKLKYVFYQQPSFFYMHNFKNRKKFFLENEKIVFFFINKSSLSNKKKISVLRYLLNFANADRHYLFLYVNRTYLLLTLSRSTKLF